MRACKIATIVLLLIAGSFLMPSCAAEEHWIVKNGTMEDLKGDCKLNHKLKDAISIVCNDTTSVQTVKPGVELIEDKLYELIDDKSVRQIGSIAANEIGFTGKGVRIAVFDTGIDCTHRDLTDSCIGGYDLIEHDTDPEDNHGHGTHVSGIITADSEEARGVAPDTEVAMMKVCDALGFCRSSDIAYAVELMVKHDLAEVASFSIGSAKQGVRDSYCDDVYLSEKLNWLATQGVTVVVGAGNDYSVISAPACASKTISVGAVESDNSVAFFSGSGYALDFMAPGVDIFSTVPGGYDTKSGTSMSTPHISGTIALMLQANPYLSTEEIKENLIKASTDAGEPGKDYDYGYGIVNAKAAVCYSIEETAACLYDVNNNRKIDNNEVYNAINDWYNDEISNGFVFEVINYWYSENEYV